MVNSNFDLLKHAIENLMPANKIFGMKVVDLKAGLVVLHVPFKEEFIGDFLQSRWHGGILASVADTAGGMAAATTLQSTQDRLNTIDMRIDYLHAAIGKDVFAKAVVLKEGKTIVKVDVQLYQDEGAEAVALARCVYSILRKNKDNEIG